jgi:hypothetical protein
LDNTPVSCLVLDEPLWASALVPAARTRGLTLLADVRGEEQRRRAVAAGMEPLTLVPRSELKFDGAVAATDQGLWPGVRIEKGGAVEARPTGGPWIETNAGFLRFARAAAPAGTAVWMVNRPPDDLVLGAGRYIQAIGDAAMTGARWVVSFNRADWELLLKRDPKALEGWQRILRVLRFYEDNRALCDLPDHSGLTLLQDASSGALVSGSLLDMIAAKHIPAEVVPAGKMGDAAFDEIRMLLNIDPASLTPEQKEKVRDVARRGATVVNGPPGWRVSLPSGGAIVFDKDQIKQIDDMWREVNGIIGRRNFAVRVFGAPGMLSNLKGDGKRMALHLVNYTDYPVESITVRTAGKYAGATLLTPRGSRKVETYEEEEGTAVEIDRIEDVAILVLEAQPKR